MFDVSSMRHPGWIRVVQENYPYVLISPERAMRSIVWERGRAAAEAKDAKIKRRKEYEAAKRANNP